MSVNLWRIEPFYDFSPNPSVLLRTRRDPAGSFTIPGQNADIEFFKESFGGDFTDRSITGRVRTNIQGTRLRGTIQWERITDSTAKTNYLTRLFSLADQGSPRYFQRAAVDGATGPATTFVIKSVGGQPAISTTGNFYQSMIVGLDAGGEPPNEFVGTFVNCTAYNGGTRTVTVDTAVTVTDDMRVDFWVPAGIPGAFFLNTLDDEDGSVACMMSGDSPVTLNVENQITRQPVEIEFTSINLLSSIPASWLK